MKIGPGAGDCGFSMTRIFDNQRGSVSANIAIDGEEMDVSLSVDPGFMNKARNYVMSISQ
jgi:hypothetical protein